MTRLHRFRMTGYLYYSICVYFNRFISTKFYQLQANEIIQAETYSKGIVNEYKITKIDEIADKIINREAIESTYLRYVADNSGLVEKIQSYNSETGNLISFFTNNAIGIVITQCQLKDQDGNDLSTYDLPTNPSRYVEMPVELHILVDKIAKYALYENCRELIYADASIEQITAPLAGGSYGMWPNNFQWSIHEIKPEGMDYYFVLVDGLMNDLEDYRTSLLID